MAICPNCTCKECISNKFENVPFTRVAGNALTARRAGRTTDGVSDLVAWAGLQAANHFRNDWRCPHCGHTFS